MLGVTKIKNFTNYLCKFDMATLRDTEPNCVKLNPENCGWFLDGHLKPKGFDGDQTPLKIEDILEITEKIMKKLPLT